MDINVRDGDSFVLEGRQEVGNIYLGVNSSLSISSDAVIRGKVVLFPGSSLSFSDGSFLSGPTGKDAKPYVLNSDILNTCVKDINVRDGDSLVLKGRQEVRNIYLGTNSSLSFSSDAVIRGKVVLYPGSSLSFSDGSFLSGPTGKDAKPYVLNSDNVYSGLNMDKENVENKRRSSAKKMYMSLLRSEDRNSQKRGHKIR